MSKLSSIYLHPSKNILHSDDLHDDALFAAAVELRIEHLFPRAEIQRAAGDRNHHLMPHDRALQVRVGIVLARLVMAVGQARGRKLFQPDLEVLNQPVFPSTTPLFATIAAISSVMRTNSWRFFVLNQR